LDQYRSKIVFILFSSLQQQQCSTSNLTSVLMLHFQSVSASSYLRMVCNLQAAGWEIKAVLRLPSKRRRSVVRVVGTP